MENLNRLYYINPLFESDLSSNPEALHELRGDPSRIARIAKLALNEKKSLNELISVELKNKTAIPIEQEFDNEELKKCEQKIVVFLNKFISSFFINFFKNRACNPNYIPSEKEVIEEFYAQLEDTEGSTIYEQIKQIVIQMYWISSEQILQCFVIEDRSQLLELAKIFVKRGESITNKFIEQFKLKEADEDQIFELISLSGLRINIRDLIELFDIKDEEKIFKLAKFLLKNGCSYRIDDFIHVLITNDNKKIIELIDFGMQFSSGLYKFVGWNKISDKNYVFEKAKIVAQSHFLGSEFPEIFGINDEKQLFEIAKIYAQTHGSFNRKLLQQFGIDDEEKRFEIAKAFAQNNEVITSFDCFYLRQFGIVDDEQLFEIASLKAQDVGSLDHHLLDGFYDLIFMFNGFSNPQIRTRYAFWLLFAFSRFNKLNNEQIQWLKTHDFLKAIFSIKIPYLLAPFTMGIIELAKSKSAREVYEKLAPSRFEKSYAWGKLLRASVASIEDQDTEHGQAALNLFDNSFQIFKDRKKFGVLLKALFQTITNKLLSVEDRKNILTNLLKSKTTLLHECYGLSALYDLGAGGKVNESQGSFVRCASEVLMQKVPFGKVEDLVTKYMKKFVDSRVPDAFMTYVSKMKCLRDEGVMIALGKFATSVLNDTFRTIRYSIDDNPHLQTIFKDNPQLFEEWKQGSSQDMTHANEIKMNSILANKDWLIQKLLTDRHLDMSKLPLLEAYLKDPLSFEEISQKLILASKEDSPPPEVRFQKLCLELCVAQTYSGNLKILNELYGILTKKPFDKPEFLNDIKGIIDAEKKTQLGKVIVVDTDDPIDLLLCGTEVSGSCQRVDGDPNLNKGLLGYLLDGKNRLLAIKDTDGRILARCLIRILWDGEKPVLFRERLYPYGINDTYKRALDALAVEKAHKLGIPLTSLDGLGEIYDKPLTGLGGPVPFEYVDGSRGVMPNGKFKISNVRFLAPKADREHPHYG